LAYSDGIEIKKQFGQHFLRDYLIVHKIVDSVELNSESSVLEIGCGDGFLTHAILQSPIARLWSFEIDPQWARYVRQLYADQKRLTICEQNFLDLDFALLEPHKKWTVLANLPYQITFPILYLFQKNRALLKEGVIMVQEEVAQKIVKTERRGYGYISLFFQHYFEWQLLDKVPPSAFLPPPKVFSRLLYFKPRQAITPIAKEELFWEFIKVIFKQPRRTLRNNLISTHYSIESIDPELLLKRAQQLEISQLLDLWNVLISTQ